MIKDVLLGDCMDIMKQIESNSIDMVLCDLPYGRTNCTWDIVIPFEQLWSHYKRIVKDNGAILLFGTQPFSSFMRLSNIKMFRYDIIWEKERPTNIFFMKKQFGKVHQIVSVFYKNQPTYNPIMEQRAINSIGVFGKEKQSNTHKNQTYKYSEGHDKTKRYPRSVLKFNRDTLKGSLHPTQKPVALCEYLIKTFSNQEDVILDNCAGSGTTGIACLNTNRSFILIQKDENFYQVIKNRISVWNSNQLGSHNG